MSSSVSIFIRAAVLGTLGIASPTVSGQEPAAIVSVNDPEAQPDELIRAADNALRGDRLIEARVLLEGLDRLQLKGGPADDAALLHAELLIATGHPLEARQRLESVGSDVRERCRAVAVLATADIQTKAYSNAEMHLRAAEGRCQGDPVFWRALGQVSLGLNLSSAAVNAYRQALSLEPKNLSIQNDLGVALIADGNGLEAIHIFAAILREAPNRDDVVVNLDFAAGMLGRIPQRGPADSDIFWSRRLKFAGAGARRSGRPGLAEALYAQALIENPQHDEALWQQYVEAALHR